MSTVAEIESAIEKLSAKEQKKLCLWLLSKRSPETPIMEKLARLGGTVEGLPSDMAKNHDHYLHGLPKRDE